MSGLIYVITNRVNGKKYVGQTRFTLRYRYRTNWWKYCHNAYLRHSIDKYGIDQFEWEIVQNDIQTEKELNEREAFWADRLNTYIPNGYNIEPCGQFHPLSEETRKKLSKINCKTHTLKRVTGEIVTIENMTEYCELNALNQAALHNLLSGSSNYSQGFVRPETDPETIPMGKVYTFMSPSGELVRGCISELCILFGLRRHTLHHLVSGTVKRSKGWTLVHDLPHSTYIPPTPPTERPKCNRGHKAYKKSLDI